MMSGTRKSEIMCVCGTILLGLPLRGAPPQEIAEPILETLRRTNSVERSTFTLQVSMEKNVGWLHQDQGTYAQSCTISRSEDGMAIACQTDHFPDPAYRPLGTSNYLAREYDLNGNLVIWMPRMHVSLWTKERNETYQEQKSFFVDPDGAVVMTGLMRVLNRYKPTDRMAWSLSEMRQIWWALGQELESDFQRVVDETFGADGERRLHLRGTRDGGSLVGEWNVVLDPSTVHLIRSASFRLDMLEASPGIEIKTKGLRRFADKALPEEGIVRFNLGTSGGQLEKRVVLHDFSYQPDKKVFDHVRKMLDAASDDELTVYDYRDNPSKPIVTRETP